MTAKEQASAGSGRGYWIALLAAAILSTTAIFIRFLTERYGMPALVLAFWRDLFAVLTLVLAFLVAKPALLTLPRAQLPYLASYGLVLAAFNALWTLSVARNGAAVATVLVYSSAAFTALLGRAIFKERLGAAKLAAVALCLGGCALVAGILDLREWKGDIGSVAIGLGAGLSYAAYSLMGRAAARRGLDPWSSLLYIFAFAAIFLLLAGLLPGSPLPGSPKRPAELLWLGREWLGWLLLFLLAAGPTVLGFGLYLVSLGYLPSSVANLVVSTEPVFTTIGAYAILGERLEPAQVAGGLLILAGVALLRIFEGRPGAAIRDLSTK